MSLGVDLDAIQAGDRVRFLVHLVNDGTDVVTIPQSTDDQVQVSLRRNDAELWRWTAGIRRRSASGTAIPPGDRIRWVCEWPDPQFGTYTAVATVSVGERDLDATAPVTVTKRVAEAAPSAGRDRESPRQGGSREPAPDRTDEPSDEDR